MDINQFLVEDVNGSLIELSYMCENTEQIWMVMVEDILTPEFETLIGKREAENDVFPSHPGHFEPITEDEAINQIGYMKPETIIDLDEYSAFNIRVFQEMTKAFEELPWDQNHPLQYFDFLDILQEAEMIEYDDMGIPRFLEDDA